MPFFQTPPSLDNQFEADRFLRSYLARVVPRDALAEMTPSLAAMGALAAGELYAMAVKDHAAEPKLTQWDAWGHRVDTIELTDVWKLAARVAAEHGVVATAYERKHGEHSRVHQFALAYLFEPSTHVYSCPLAMTDGAAKTLSTLDPKELVARALPRLVSRDASSNWTSGQWMTERTGGSDVAISETVARQADGAWRLFGTKWFTSATTSQMALTLARPEGNPPGGGGLALFYVETRDASGKMNGIQINRLKDKLGTRMVPTAELTLDGAIAVPVAGLKDGIKNITPMLNVTRTWNAICATAGVRRGLALARDYAKKRVAFGAPLAEKALHVDTLAGVEAEYEGAFLLAFRAVELLGREEARTLTEDEAALQRLLTPIAKLTTAKQAVAGTSDRARAAARPRRVGKADERRRAHARGGAEVRAARGRPREGRGIARRCEGVGGGLRGDEVVEPISRPRPASTTVVTTCASARAPPSCARGRRSRDRAPRRRASWLRRGCRARDDAPPGDDDAPRPRAPRPRRGGASSSCACAWWT